MQELIVLVNDKNEEIGTMEKLAAHTANTPLHRAFSCYVFNQKGEFLVTQRAKSKKVFPGIWTNSCCGHPGPGETTEDAIRRRLDYELGFVPDTIKLILPDFRYKTEMNGIIENEICPVYIVTISTELHANEEEVEDYRWESWEGFKNDIEKSPKVYSYWCKKQSEELSRIKNFPKKYL